MKAFCIKLIIKLIIQTTTKLYIPDIYPDIYLLIILKLDLSDVGLRLCRDLSGGKKRKVFIALALLSGGKIILLDEPTSGMDVIAKKKLWEFIKNYQKDKILLVTTHSLEEAEYIIISYTNWWRYKILYLSNFNCFRLLPFNGNYV